MGQHRLINLGKPTRPKPQHLNNEPGPASNLFDGLDVASSGPTSAEPPKSEPTPPKSLLIDFDDPQVPEESNLALT